MEAGKHVARDAAVGHGLAYLVDAVEIPLAGILAVHELQYLVAATLHRQVDVVAYVVVGSHGGNDVVGQVLGVARGEAHAHLGSRLGHDAQQLGKVDGGAAV